MAIKKTRRKTKPVAKPMTFEQAVEHGVSQSGLTTFNECKRKRRLNEEGWRPRIVRTPLAYGHLGHEILETLYVESKKGKFKNLLDKTKVERRVLKFIDAHREEHTEYNEQMLQNLELWAVQLSITLGEYFSYWGKEELAWDWIGIERDIPKIPFGGTVLQGRLDYVYNMKKKGIGFMDTKFKGQISEEALIDLLETDFQLLFYALAIKIEFEELPKEAVYNCIRRPGLKLGKNETLKQYGERLREHIVKDPDHYFKRFIVPFDHTLLDRFEPELEEMIAEYLEWHKAGCPARLYGNPCDSKYGICEFYGLCHRDEKFNFVLKERKD